MFTIPGIWAMFLCAKEGEVIAEMCDGYIWQWYATGYPGAQPIRI